MNSVCGRINFVAMADSFGTGEEWISALTVVDNFYNG